MAKLSEKILQGLIKAGVPIAGRSDGNGLTFTMSSTGSAAWVLRYRIAGRPRELTLGGYPDLSLEAARKRARAERVKVDSGVDVALAKRAQRLETARESTFRTLAEHYLERAGCELKPRTVMNIKKRLEKDLYPRFGNLAAPAVTPGLIVDAIEAIGRRSDSVARHCFEHLSVIFAHGLARRSVASNPCAGLRVSAILGKPRPPRERKNLELEELRALMRAAPLMVPENGLMLKILLATCVRKSELVLAKKVHVDLAASTWRVPDENAKGGRGYLIPLAPLAAGWFRELIEFAGESQWVLPARIGRARAADRPIHERTINEAIERLRERKLPELRQFSPHDLRSTARSQLAALGIDIIVAERCLNHSLGGLVAVYDKYDYMTERRRALEVWAGVLSDLEPRPNVLPLLRAAA